ncbi:MAG: NAD(P)/FAD-dependent oxidoreductase [Candidatus Margulisbacteria bacterium]|nr:NAD(P)/FAD-dependent oxidoreductase [Candidatus Margulisiibacteriota bacterium]
MEKVSVAIIGAGVVGLAIAAELSKKHKDIVLVEKESSFGQETSSRNSEIIHAGIYYEKDSLKAKLCVEGRDLLYAFCLENKIPHKKLGKLIIALDENEHKQLESLKGKAENNGVNDLIWLNSHQIKDYEPSVDGYSALFSPSTGIVDSHSLMKCLEQKAEMNGVMISYGSKVTAIEQVSDGYRVEINHEYSFVTGKLINSAGLFADKIAEIAGIDVKQKKYKLYYCKGEYFSYDKPSFINHLVYPVPEQDLKGLGVHSVVDLGGLLKFGPNAFYVDELNYDVNISHRKNFYDSIKKMFPQIQEQDLSPDQSGIRPKLSGPGQGIRDFVINEDLPGFINLIGIESPGLTASLGVGRYVADLV